MPLYEYRCKKCGHLFEKIQSFSAPDETECPVCKGELERLISASAVQFKGSGFYSTDYGSKSSRKGQGSSSDSGGSSDKAASSGSSEVGGSASSDSGSGSSSGSESSSSKPSGKGD